MWKNQRWRLVILKILQDTSTIETILKINLRLVNSSTNYRMWVRHEAFVMHISLFTFFWDSDQFSMTYVELHRTFISSNNCTGCLTPLWTWRDLNSSLRCAEDHSLIISYEWSKVRCYKAHLYRNCTYQSQLISLGSINIRRMLINVVWVIIFCLAPSWDQGLSYEIDYMCETPGQAIIRKYDHRNNWIYRICHFCTSKRSPILSL